MPCTQMVAHALCRANSCGKPPMAIAVNTGVAEPIMQKIRGEEHAGSVRPFICVKDRDGAHHEVRIGAEAAVITEEVNGLHVAVY